MPATAQARAKEEDTIGAAARRAAQLGRPSQNRIGDMISSWRVSAPLRESSMGRTTAEYFVSVLSETGNGARTDLSFKLREAYHPVVLETTVESSLKGRRLI